MKLRNISVVLLALLLAAMAMVPMAAAADESDGTNAGIWSQISAAERLTASKATAGSLYAYSYGKKSGSSIVFAGKGYVSGGSAVSSMQVTAVLYNPSGSAVSSIMNTCSNVNTCYAGDRTYYPGASGTYNVVTTVTATGYGSASATTGVTY